MGTKPISSCKEGIKKEEVDDFGQLDQNGDYAKELIDQSQYCNNLPQLSPASVSEVLEQCQHSMKQSDINPAVAGSFKSTLPVIPRVENFTPNELSAQPTEASAVRKSIEESEPGPPASPDRMVFNNCLSAKQVSDTTAADGGQKEAFSSCCYDVTMATPTKLIFKRRTASPAMPIVNDEDESAEAEPAQLAQAKTSTICKKHPTEPASTVVKRDNVVTKRHRAMAAQIQELDRHLFSQSERRYKYLHRFIINLLLMSDIQLKPHWVAQLPHPLVKFCRDNKRTCGPPDPGSLLDTDVHFRFSQKGTVDVGILWALYKNKDKDFSFVRVTDAISRSLQRKSAKSSFFVPVPSSPGGQGKPKLLYRFGPDAWNDWEMAAAAREDDASNGPPCPKSRRLNDSSIAPSVATSRTKIHRPRRKKTQ